MRSNNDTEDKTCFVAMPITTPDSYQRMFDDSSHFPHVLDHLFRPALEQTGYTVIPPSASGADLIHAEIIRNLEQATLLLCDLSSLNPNVFFELGIRTSLDRIAVIVKDNYTSQIPFDLNAIHVFTYDGSLTPWTLTQEIQRLANHIAATTKATDDRNAMWRYFGLTKRANPSDAGSNPIEAKLDLLIEEMTKSQTVELPLLPPNIVEAVGLPTMQRADALTKEIEGALRDRHFTATTNMAHNPRGNRIYIRSSDNLPPGIQASIHNWARILDLSVKFFPTDS
jgi:hypothetical protein